MPHSNYPPIIQWRRDACNGMYPSAKFIKNAVDAENHLTAHRHKEVFRCDWRLGSLTQAIAGAGSSLRKFRFRTGHGAVKLRAYVILAKCGPIGGNAAVTSSTKIDVTLSGGGTTTMGPWQHPITADATPGDEPSSWFSTVTTISVAANSIYECDIITTNYARPVAIVVYEIGSPTVDEATPYYNQRAPQAGGPLYDADREKLLVGFDGMLRHNGGTLIHWGMSTGGTRTRTSATPINLIDNTTTGAPGAASPGFHIDTTYRRTASRTTVPFELAVYASNLVGVGAVTLRNSGGVVATCAIAGGAAWYTTTASLTAGADKFDFQFYGDGVNALTVYAVSLIEWET